MSRNDKLSMYKTKITTFHGYTSVTYWSTEIVKFNQDLIILNFGGHDTVTTRRKMNQASKQFGLEYAVFRYKGNTYVNSTGDLDVSSSVQYYGRSITIGKNKGYGSIS